MVSLIEARWKPARAENRPAADLFAAPAKFLGFQSSYTDFATGADLADAARVYRFRHGHETGGFS
jgi:hypothetical protein